jgi:GNAT superfamily N-acetyltransferase
VEWIAWSETNDRLKASAMALLDAERGPADEASRWRAGADTVNGLTVVSSATGALLGCALTWPTDAQRFRVELAVSATQRGSGVGTQLLERLMTLAASQGARTVQARADHANHAGIAFLLRRGFRETLRMHRFVVDPARAALPPGAQARIEANGITISTLANERVGGLDVYAQLGALYDAASDEWPDADPPDPTVPRTPLTGERVRAMYERWRAIPDAVFIARTRDDYAGFTGLCEGGKSVGTAVHPRFRDMGVATALKVRLLEWAKTHGVGPLRSATAHPAMIRIHRRLGFQQERVESCLVRKLG